MICGGCLSFAPFRSRAISKTLFNDCRTSEQAVRLLAGGQAATAPSHISALSLKILACCSAEVISEPDHSANSIGPIVRATNSVRFLQDQLLAFVESLQGAGDRKRQEQSYQGEYGALDGVEPGHGRRAFPSETARTEVASEIQ